MFLSQTNQSNWRESFMRYSSQGNNFGRGEVAVADANCRAMGEPSKTSVLFIRSRQSRNQLH
jgi:hypothetical protein